VEHSYRKVRLWQANCHRATQQIFHNQPILRVARVLQSQLERTRKASSSTTNAREHVFVQARMYFHSAANSSGYFRISRPFEGGCDDGLVIHGHEMSILDLFLAAISLAPPGLLLLFWRMFPNDRGIHPIYRGSRSNDTQKDRGISTCPGL
jgi:hypothetical protein